MVKLVSGVSLYLYASVFYGNGNLSVPFERYLWFAGSICSIFYHKCVHHLVWGLLCSGLGLDSVLPYLSLGLDLVLIL